MAGPPATEARECGIEAPLPLLGFGDGQDDAVVRPSARRQSLALVADRAEVDRLRGGMRPAARLGRKNETFDLPTALSEVR